MKRILMMLALAAFLVAALSVSALSAFAAPKACEPGDPGCKSETQQTKPAGASPGFNETETQRGNVNAKGTESTETQVCTGPSGKPLSPDHPQCS